MRQQYSSHCLIFPLSPVFWVTRLMLFFIFHSTLFEFLDDLYMLWFYLPNLPCYKFCVKIKLFGIWLLAWKRRNLNKNVTSAKFKITGRLTSISLNVKSCHCHRTRSTKYFDQFVCAGRVWTLNCIVTTWSQPWCALKSKCSVKIKLTWVWALLFGMITDCIH